MSLLNIPSTSFPSVSLHHTPINLSTRDVGFPLEYDATVAASEDLNLTINHDEGLPFPTEELGIRWTLNIFHGNIIDKCVDMGNVHVFVSESSHSSWTELFGEFWRSTRTRNSMKFRAYST